MTLRRTTIARRTELRRTGPIPSRAPRARAPRPVKRPKDTGPSRDERQVVLDRAGGCCELCGRLLHDGYDWIRDHSDHHRQPRGQGGTTNPAANSPTNRLLLCGTGVTGCHGWVERNRRAAYDAGLLVAHGIHDPGRVPVELAQGRVWLTGDGRYTDTPPTQEG